MSCVQAVRFVLATVIGAAGFAPLACGGGTAPTLPGSSSTSPAAQAANRLQSWYQVSTGLYAAPTNWWNAANAMTALVDYQRITGDNSFQAAVANTFTRAQASHPNFINDYYDDMGWWALAWVDAFDLTHDPSYLAMAETIFTGMTGAWDSTCGGGLWWSTARTYKNAIPNELFLSLAARLANRTTGTEQAGYLSWAQKEWAWFRASGMINSSNLINDGLTSTCANNNRTVWSYNMGVVLGGLLELSRAANDPSLLAEAQTLANAAIAPTSPLINPDGILVDRTVNGGDTPQFKGIFVRNLRELYTAAPDARWKTFIQTNATSLLTNDNSNFAFGALWQGPVDSTDGTRQTSALDLLNAAAAMK